VVYASDTELRELTADERASYFRAMQPLWGGGLAEEAFVAFQRRLAASPEATGRYRMFGLFPRGGGDLLSGVKNVHVSVKETPNEIIFLRHVEPGSANKSYGIEVARLAGLPRSVIERAREVLKKHEQSEHQLSETLSPGESEAATNGQHAQSVLFTPLDRAVLDKLRDADLDQLKPLDALNLLADLKKQIL